MTPEEIAARRERLKSNLAPLHRRSESGVGERPEVGPVEALEARRSGLTPERVAELDARIDALTSGERTEVAEGLRAEGRRLHGQGRARGGIMTPEEIAARRERLKSNLALIESVQAKIRTFDQDHDYLEEFAARLLSVSGQKKNRLRRVYPKPGAGRRRWELLVEYAKKMLPVQDFASAAKPLEDRLQSEWKILNEQLGSLVKAFETDAVPETLQPSGENGPWQLMAKGPDQAQLAAFASKLGTLGVVASVAEDASTGTYRVEARLAEPVDTQIVHVMLRAEREAEEAVK